MVLIFVSVVSCSSGDTEGICQYRDQAMVGGAGLMMALFGLKIAQRKKKKPTDLKAKSNWYWNKVFIYFFNFLLINKKFE